jgi:hypothetical protein
VRPERYEAPYQPVLDPADVIAVDTTSLDAVDTAEVAASVRRLLSSSPGEAPTRA